MLKHRLIAPLLASMVTIWTGCITPKSYVDPSLKIIEASSIHRDDPKIVILETQFLRNGILLPEANSHLMHLVRLNLLASGAIKEVITLHDSSHIILNISMNNVGDMGVAHAKGFYTGISLGFVGSMVTDGYIFIATVRRPGQPPIEKVYKHAIHTTIGNKSGPKGLEPMNPSEAYDRVVSGLVFNLVRDLQADGVF